MKVYVILQADKGECCINHNLYFFCNELEQNEMVASGSGSELSDRLYGMGQGSEDVYFSSLCRHY